MRKRGCGWEWTKTEDRILLNNHAELTYREIAQLLQVAGYTRSEDAIGGRLRALRKSRYHKYHTHPVTRTEQIRYNVLESAIIRTRNRILSGELRTEQPGSPAVQAVDIVLRGCNQNPGILDELVEITREESTRWVTV